MIESTKTMELFSSEQVSKHDNKDDCWVTLYGRKIYDVSKYLKDYPKGEEFYMEYAGRDVTDALKNEKDKKKLDELYSKLEDDIYLVGYLATSEEASNLLTNKDHKVEVNLKNEGSKGEYDSTIFVKDLPDEKYFTIATDHKRDLAKHHFLDLDKPLIPQILWGNFKKDFYVDQVNRPRHYGKGSAKLFGNFLEPLSLTPWYVIPIVWLPVVYYHFSVALKNMNSILAIFLFGVGIFVWTFIEYCLHRFLFHFDFHLPQNNIAFVIHFLLHGFHHYLPMDPYRLVMPPTLFIILCAPFYWGVFKLLPLYWAYAGFAGGLFGYVYYDLCHYFLHHSKVPRFMRKLKKFHLEHHYKNYQLAFGITNMFWDKLLGTYLDANSPLPKRKYD